MSARDERVGAPQPGPTDQPPVPASWVGHDLRAARERQGWTLPAIAAHLRIRLPFLEAIEEGRVADLPGNAYAVGFIRTYAVALGLDAAEIARRFRDQAGEVNRRTELDFPAPVPDRAVPALAVVVIGAVIAVVAYVGWYRMSGNDRPVSQVVQQVPERLAPLVPEKPAPERPAERPPSAVAVLPPPPPVAPVPFVPPSSAAAATTQPSVSVALAPPPQAAPPAIETAAEPARADGVRIVLRATADAWMQVRDKGGQLFLNRVLKSGDSFAVPPKPGLFLTTGNAGGTEVAIDGAASTPLGADGAVKREIPLDPDALRDRLAVTNIGPAIGPSPAPRPTPISPHIQ